MPGSFVTDISYTLWYFSINGIQATSLANRYIMSAPVMSLSKMKQLGDFSAVLLPVFPDTSISVSVNDFNQGILLTLTRGSRFERSTEDSMYYSLAL